MFRGTTCISVTGETGNTHRVQLKDGFDKTLSGACTNRSFSVTQIYLLFLVIAFLYGIILAQRRMIVKGEKGTPQSISSAVLYGVCLFIFKLYSEFMMQVPYREQRTAR